MVNWQPPPHKQCWTCVSKIFPKFQHCIGWERENIVKIHVYCIIVPSTFVQDVVIIAIFVSLCSPAPVTPPPKEEEWSDVPSDVVHLTDSTFDDFTANNPSVLVMFYAPCKYPLLTEFI